VPSDTNDQERIDDNEHHPFRFAPMEESLFQTAPPVTARPRWQSLSRGREYEDGKEPIAANGVIRIDRLTGRQTTLSSGGMCARPLAITVAR
jgi:hypothetical protein